MKIKDLIIALTIGAGALPFQAVCSSEQPKPIPIKTSYASCYKEGFSDALKDIENSTDTSEELKHLLKDTKLKIKNCWFQGYVDGMGANNINPFEHAENVKKAAEKAKQPK